MKPCELITYVTAVACFISESCSEEELPIIIAMLTQLSDTLRTIIVQQEICNKKTAEVFNREVEEVINKDAEE